MFVVLAAQGAHAVEEVMLNACGYTTLCAPFIAQSPVWVIGLSDRLGSLEISAFWTLKGVRGYVIMCPLIGLRNARPIIVVRICPVSFKTPGEGNAMTFFFTISSTKQHNNSLLLVVRSFKTIMSRIS